MLLQMAPAAPLGAGVGFLQDAGGVGAPAGRAGSTGGLGGGEQGRWEPGRPSSLGVGVRCGQEGAEGG